MKVAIVGAGLRTPLLIHGLTRARPDLDVDELVLFDRDFVRADLMAAMGQEIARGSGMRIRATQRLEEAVEDCSFVVSSIRVGGMEARARDERISLEHGFAGQETTGPGGLAMAMRTIPVAIEHARLVERRAPRAWLINFTNPAGMVTQSISMHTNARVVGICDTPAELFFRIQLALGEPAEDVECAYFGLNHLGWVPSVRVRGTEVIDRLFAEDGKLESLYPSKLFDPELLRSMRLIPTEYLFFYYSKVRAMRNQLAARATRGEELVRLNAVLLADLAAKVADGQPDAALETYKKYLNQRNSSYLRLEGAAESAFLQPEHDWDPFEGATGYHRIAVDVMCALAGGGAKRIILNLPNRGAIEGLESADVVEIPCVVDQSGLRALPVAAVPEPARSLIFAVKEYERLAIRAAVDPSHGLAAMALTANPIVGDWDEARAVLADLA